MSDVTLSYKGSDILELSDSGSATLKTGGKYCEADIAVEYVKPSGGGAVVAEYIHTEDWTNDATGNALALLNTYCTMGNGYYYITVPNNTSTGNQQYTLISAHVIVDGNGLIFPTADTNRVSSITRQSGVRLGMVASTSCYIGSGSTVVVRFVDEGVLLGT